MRTVRWIVQTNLGSGDDAKTIIEACKELGVEVVGVEPIPFDTELPTIPQSDSVDVFYGSTNFIKNAYGLMYNFNVLMYDKHYGEHFLNHGFYGGTMALIKEYVRKNQNKDYDFFVRPIEDIKEFAGMHTNAEQFLKWADGLDDECEVNDRTHVMVAEPKPITHEWRLFYVGGEFSTGSYYRCNSKGMFIDYLPDKVIEFADKMVEMWKPHDNFVIDIAESEGELYVIECNGWNSCGFYRSDIKKLVKDVTEYYNDEITKGNL